MEELGSCHSCPDNKKNMHKPIICVFSCAPRRTETPRTKLHLEIGRDRCKQCKPRTGAAGPFTGGNRPTLTGLQRCVWGSRRAQTLGFCVPGARRLVGRSAARALLMAPVWSARSDPPPRTPTLPGRGSSESHSRGEGSPPVSAEESGVQPETPVRVASQVWLPWKGALGRRSWV